MNKYIIAYDLYVPGQKWAQLDKAIPQLGTAVKILRTTWLLRTNFGHDKVEAHLKSLSDSNDKLAVLQITGEGTVSGFSANEIAALRSVTAAA